jgi:aspartate racemase
MKILGMIGGLGPETTVDYYRFILAGFRQRQPTGYPQMVINSLDVDRGIAMLDAGKLDELADYLAEGVAALERAGADFGVIAANTPHIVFDEVQARSKLPLLSIVGVTARRAKEMGLKKVGLFGTGFTMKADFYPKAFAKEGIELVRPGEDEREYIHKAYIGELLKNQFLPATRTRILEIAARMKKEDGVEVVALAGTELPLLLREAPAKPVEFLDTTIIHVEAIVDELLRD